MPETTDTCGCDDFRVSRRTFLHAGALAMGGLALMQTATELTLSWEVKEGANLVGGARAEA